MLSSRASRLFNLSLILINFSHKLFSVISVCVIVEDCSSDISGAVVKSLCRISLRIESVRLTSALPRFQDVQKLLWSSLLSLLPNFVVTRKLFRWIVDSLIHRIL